mgnify:CR=1 FL=1
MFVLALLGISLVAGSCIQSQWRRDHACASMLHEKVERVEASALKTVDCQRRASSADLDCP